jgi:16S rRNA (cytosine1402-N4)-methyltransferase
MSEHITVLKEESITALSLSRGSVVIDATANGGGHTLMLAECVGRTGIVLAIDVDQHACTLLREKARALPQVRVIHANFRQLDAILREENIKEVDGILADLGWSTNQFEPQEGIIGRGFSFMYDEPLHMTYGTPEHYPFTAYDIVNRWNEEDISNVLYAYADERLSRKIARTIVTARAKEPITTSKQLGGVIEETIRRRGRLHPATKTFQALRIAVNDEYAALEHLIASGVRHLKKCGRFGIITFHSGEDRIVKRAFKAQVDSHLAIAPIKKPILPSREEVRVNPRSRSAKLRIIERL